MNEDGRLLSLAELKDETVTQRQARKIRVKKEIAERGKAIKEISTRGFEFPKQEPTIVPRQTFSGKVDPTDPESLLGELIRTKVVKGVKGEKEIREIGKMIRYAISNVASNEIEDRKQVSFEIEKRSRQFQEVQLREIEAIKKGKPTEAFEKNYISCSKNLTNSGIPQRS